VTTAFGLRDGRSRVAVTRGVMMGERSRVAVTRGVMIGERRLAAGLRALRVAFGAPATAGVVVADAACSGAAGGRRG
jgi:hypothetical protein